MNFLLAAWETALEEAGRVGLARERLLRDRLVPHSRGLEILPIPHRLGRLAVRRFLARHGCRPGEGERLPIELADALAGPLAELPAGETGVLPVVLGNPPYAGRSANRGAWITGLLHGYRLPDGREEPGYYRVDGRPLGERNPKWLQDDAVKFLRLAQWRVDQAGAGLVALVLNHNGLDAPTFRGLRASLLGTFDESTP